MLSLSRALTKDEATSMAAPRRLGLTSGVIMEPDMSRARAMSVPSTEADEETSWRMGQARATMTQPRQPRRKANRRWLAWTFQLTGSLEKAWVVLTPRVGLALRYFQA